MSADASSPSVASSSTASSPPPPPPQEQPRKIKKANLPFLVHQRYLARQAKEKEEAQRRKEAGLPPLPPKGAPLLWTVLKWTVLALVTSSFLSRSATGTWNWGYEGKYDSLAKVSSTLLPTPQIYFTEERLALHDGTDPAYPVYVALDGDVYDVSASAKTYGPGGGYNIFAGKDAARAFITGCFKTHLTHDLRGLTEKDLGALAHWKGFFANHATYKKVGRVGHPPIDPSTPIPAPCNAKAEGGAI
ncbi:cytochrome b5-like heme/steroid binding domain-containing protein [Leucosporidium creatinivorum]|uniref:Cytochrome b5-like heme/steroid binding domain-containing protein n=1 Tax=Leucosporidium creatinivorum TaxID=106004 RepID=A0A1Y2G3Y3_9BASI|nr:cytochrome b5-like heme/steroid binding domain-containing protein [Leucosporidium creatinivorum]